MKKAYETGTRQQVIDYLITCAIRDRMSYIDCYVTDGRSGLKVENLPAYAQIFIKQAQAEIRDFKKIQAVLK